MYRTEFYETSAQLLPVLYLTMLVEYRLLSQSVAGKGPSRARDARAVLIYVVVTTFVFAEYVCLRFLATGERTIFGGMGMVVAAYVVAALGLAFPPLAHFIERIKMGRSRWHMLRLAAITVFVQYLFILPFIIFWR